MRVAVGMSGGLDSSAAAAVLIKAGHEVRGITAEMWSAAGGQPAIAAERAEKVATMLGIPHERLDIGEQFKTTVVAGFIDEYTVGRTPSPCIICNAAMKFGLVMEHALRRDCDFFATGHYARVERRDCGVRLLRARDRRRDQSYFLHRLNAAQLMRVVFPLGDLTREEAAAEVHRRGLPVGGQRSSRDLCFVAGSKYSELVEAEHPELKREGQICDSAGRVLGRHAGCHRYTVGQRTGLGIAVGRPMYVLAVETRENRVIVGPRAECMREGCRVAEVHWIAGAPPATDFECHVQIRHRHEAATARVRVTSEGEAEIEFAEPQFAVTPGQAAVMYDGDEVLGGGWIEG